MEKSKLLGFINRYHLNGNCEAVIVKETENGVTCNLIDSDQTVVGSVEWKTDSFIKGELGINHTATLIKMLSALNENINIDVKSSSGKNYSMEIKEGSTKMTFMLADTTVIPAVPAINQEPEYEVSIDLDDVFTSRFIKAKNALPDAKNFAVQVKEGKTRFIINYTTINADNISFEIDGGSNPMDPIMYSADKLKEILTANKGDMGTLHVSSQGLAKVEFHGQDFDSKYFLVQLQN